MVLINQANEHRLTNDCVANRRVVSAFCTQLTQKHFLVLDELCRHHLDRLDLAVDHHLRVEHSELADSAL